MQDPAVDTTSADPAAMTQGGRRAWASDPRTLAMIAAASFLLLALVALASVIDLPQRETQFASGAAGSGELDFGNGLGEPGSSGEAGQDGEGLGDSGGSGGSDSQGLNGNGGEGFQGFGDGGSARIDAGGGNGFDVRPFPGCPGAFAIGENILVVPDPEACGLKLVPPGTFEPDPNGLIILVPSPDGNVGGLRFRGDGNFDLVAPGDVRPDDLVIGLAPDGSFDLQRPDGSRVEINPGQGGLDLRDPSTGTEEFVPGPSDESMRDLFEDGESGAETDGDTDPDQQQNQQEDDRAQERQEERDAEREQDRDRDEPVDLSFLAPVLVVLLICVVLAFLAMAFKDTSFRRSPKVDLDDDEEDLGSGAQDTLVDYAAEINALDRLLWEIDQEPDPRTAIRRVYAALETGLDNPEMARRRSETPGIYLRRILGRFDGLELPLRELTLLFEQARFSEHEITHDMRDRAVTILVAVRGHYADAAAHAQAQAYADEQAQNLVAP